MTWLEPKQNYYKMSQFLRLGLSFSETCQGDWPPALPPPTSNWNLTDLVLGVSSLYFFYLRLAWRWERDFPDFSSVFFVSSEMELQEEVKRGGLYWLRELLELLWLELREGWNMDSEWVRETLALFLNTAMAVMVDGGRGGVLVVRDVESLVAYWGLRCSPQFLLSEADWNWEWENIPTFCSLKQLLPGIGIRVFTRGNQILQSYLILTWKTKFSTINVLKK